jgi:hypothetical protein
MMKSINEAYFIIRHAPLRYARPKPTNVDRKAAGSRPQGSAEPSLVDLPSPNLASIEFWTRFVFGALWGLILSFGMLVRFGGYSTT